MGEIDAAAVAVLAERVDRSLSNFDELRGLLLGLNARFVEIEKKQAVHQFILKSTGIVLMSCVGLIGWGWHQGEKLYTTDISLDRRTMLIEYKLGLQVPTAEGNKQ